MTFDIELHSPGILQITYVHATDEWPYWALSTYNDTFLAMIKKLDCGSGPYKNFIVFRGRNNVGQVEENLLSLAELRACDFLKENYVPPVPTDLETSHHATGLSTTDLYDHEFAGFTVPLTFEATSPLPTSPLYRNTLAPGTYRIKLVIQDVHDFLVDSAAFIPANSLKLFPLAHGDYNGDGVVDTDDYLVWSSNYGTGTKFYEGDGNGDCVVDAIDYTVWRNNLGATGNADIASDFNRDGCVDLNDLFIINTHAGTESCAGRAQGDTDGDGDVDQDDIDTFVEEWYTGCGSGLLSMDSDLGAQLESLGIDADSTIASTIKNKVERATRGAINATTSTLAPVAKAIGIVPENPDVNNDGVVDEADLVILNEMILGDTSE